MAPLRPKRSLSFPSSHMERKGRREGHTQLFASAFKNSNVPSCHQSLVLSLSWIWPVGFVTPPGVERVNWSSSVFLHLEPRVYSASHLFTLLTSLTLTWISFARWNSPWSPSRSRMTFCFLITLLHTRIFSVLTALTVLIWYLASPALHY